MKYKWAWVSNHYGERGWFTEESRKRAEEENPEDFKDGHWREISGEELAATRGFIANLVRQQS